MGNEKMSYTETRLSLSFNLAKVSVQGQEYF